jgi:hypothetical protein
MGGGSEDDAKGGDAGDGVGDGFDMLNYINFRWDMVSPSELSGRFIVKPKTSQVSPLLLQNPSPFPPP